MRQDEPKNLPIKMNCTEINPSQITIINDGQVMYPVLTAELNQWIAEHGKITASNYEQFCADVEYVGAEMGTPGNAALIALCNDLLANGADFERLG